MFLERAFCMLYFFCKFSYLIHLFEKLLFEFRFYFDLAGDVAVNYEIPIIVAAAVRSLSLIELPRYHLITKLIFNFL